MSIKFYQNGKGIGLGGRCEFDTEKDYGNEYASVHFRIETPTFNNANGFFGTTEENENWRNEANNLLNSLGIANDCGFKIEHSEEKCAYLHPHPQDISGIVRKNDIRKIAEAINNMSLSSIRWVDILETVYVLTDKEYEDYLATRKVEMRTALFLQASTTRTNKYLDMNYVANSLAGQFRLSRLGYNDGKNYGIGQTGKYLIEVAKEMIEEGYLKAVTENGNTYIRSLNKTEQKKANLTPLNLENLRHIPA